MGQDAENISKIVLNNGVRVLLDRDRRFSTAAVAICISGGLRDESRSEIGLTHLLEHLLFKRTKDKSTLEIAAAIDDLGADINAFTDAESLCLTGAVPAERFSEVLEFLAELSCETDFTERDLELEKEVIRQEILECDDDPGQVTYQNYSECFWPYSTLGCPVFGTVETVAGFSAPDVWRRREQMLQGSRIIIAAVGDIDPDKFCRIVEKKFSHLPSGSLPLLAEEKTSYGYRQIERPVGQIHFALGQAWPSLKSDQFPEAVIAASVLGSGMSSRLFQLLREQHGLAYDVGADIDAYDNTAALVIDGIVDPSTLNQSLSLIASEFENLRRGKLTSEEIARAIKMSCAQLKMETDSAKSRLWRMVETEQLFGQYRSSAQAIERFSRVTRKSTAEFLERWLTEDKFTLVLCGPTADIRIDSEIENLCGQT